MNLAENENLKKKFSFINKLKKNFFFNKNFFSFFFIKKKNFFLFQKFKKGFPFRFFLKKESSADSIHSWAVPEFGVKIDAIPGRLNQVIIFTSEVGRFFLIFVLINFADLIRKKSFFCFALKEKQRVGRILPVDFKSKYPIFLVFIKFFVNFFFLKIFLYGENPKNNYKFLFLYFITNFFFEFLLR